MQTMHLIGRIAKKNWNEERGTLSLVVPSTERYTNKQGQKVEDTEWFVVKIFSPRAGKIKDWIETGQLVSVIGRVKTSAYINKAGEAKSETRLICDKIEWFNLQKKENTTESFNNQLRNHAQEVDIDDDDSDLPF